MQHAFFIQAFNNPNNLNRLLELLDDKRFQLFLHLDVKTKITQRMLYSPKCATLHLVPSINVRWGHFSIIECVLRIIEFALNYDWDYCHFITENDLPLKTPSEIYRVFEEHNGKEFVDFAPENYSFAHYKCDVYHLFPGLSRYRQSKILKLLNHCFAKAQWVLGFRRNHEKLFHGSAYFSITRKLAAYIIFHADYLRRRYSYTLAADEVWLQTLLWHSEFFSNVHEFEKPHAGNLRYIDWSRRNGNSPYTFDSEDYQDLISTGSNTDLCFARKFSDNSFVAEQLYKHLLLKDNRL